MVSKQAWAEAVVMKPKKIPHHTDHPTPYEVFVDDRLVGEVFYGPAPQGADSHGWTFVAGDSGKRLQLSGSWPYRDTAGASFEDVRGRLAQPWMAEVLRRIGRED